MEPQLSVHDSDTSETHVAIVWGTNLPLKRNQTIGAGWVSAPPDASRATFVIYWRSASG